MATNWDRNNVTKADATEIEKGKIVRARSMFNRFKYIFEPLLKRAKQNYRELSSAIDRANTRYPEIGAEDYFTFNGNKFIDKFDRIKNLAEKFDALQRAWNSANNNNCDDGISGYNPNGGSGPEGTDPIANPLHLHAPNVKQASGKVRPHDFIAAYNFRGFLEGLYAIAAEMRNISLKIKKNNSEICSVGKGSRFESYRDLTTIISTGDDQSVTDISILPADLNKSAIYNFTDFILNHATDGQHVTTPKDSRNSEDSEDSEDSGNSKANSLNGYEGKKSLIPNNLETHIKESEYYINTNKQGRHNIGHQTTNHLQIKESDRDLSDKITSYYNLPISRLDDFPYADAPSSGIVREYETLSPAENISSTEKSPGTPSLINFIDVSAKLNHHFVYNPDPNLRSDRILSKTYTDSQSVHHPQVIGADRVNSLFKQLNVLAAQISASLCGEFEINKRGGIIGTYEPPLAGLGYPCVFNWYFGDRITAVNTGSTAHLAGITTVKDKITDDPESEWEEEGAITTYLRERAWRTGHPTIKNDFEAKGVGCANHGNSKLRTLYNLSAILNNGNQMGAEEYELSEIENKRYGPGPLPSRVGMPYFEISSVTDASKYEVSSFVDNIIVKSRSSTVPVLINKFAIGTKTPPTPTKQNKYKYDFKQYGISNFITNANSNRYKVFTGVTNPFNGNNIQIKSEIINNELSAKQFFNRYCLVHPMSMSQYLDEIADSVHPAKLNANTWYIFSPYMTWFNKVLTTNNDFYNGKIPNVDSGYSKISFSRSGSKKLYLHNDFGIPVIYVKRNCVWSLTPENEGPKFNSKLGTEILNNNSSVIGRYGTVQLKPYTIKNNEKKYKSPSEADDLGNVKWFEYLISCGVAINEVSHTHPGGTHTELKIDDVLIKGGDIYTEYSPDGSGGSVIQKPGVVKTAEKNIDGISSIAFIGTDNYGASHAVTASAQDYLSSSTEDAQCTLFGNRFKFNDFYSDYHPFSEYQLDSEIVSPYFLADNYNYFVQGLRTKNISWRTRIPTTVTRLPTFDIDHYIVHSTGKNEKNNIDPGGATLQGYFYYSANQSTKFNIDNNEYYYKIVPQPDPISVDVLKMIKINNNPTYYGMLVMKGKINRLWNNISSVDISWKSNINSGKSYELLLNNNIQADIKEFRDPFCTNRPEVTANITSTTDEYRVIQGSGSYHNFEYDKYKNGYNIDISVGIMKDSWSTTPIGGSVSCQMVFTNENGGFRKVCNENGNKFQIELITVQNI